MRDRVAGALLAGMLLTSIAGGLAPTLVSPALTAVFGWPAAALLWPRLGRRHRMLVTALAVAGTLGMVVGVLRGHPPDWELALAGNQSIIGMLLGISFLVLVTGGATEQGGRAGRPAVWRTLLGVHIFGAVINLSSIHLIGDRLVGQRHATGSPAESERQGGAEDPPAHDGNPDPEPPSGQRPADGKDPNSKGSLPGRSGLSRAEALLLSRGFSSAAFWSPFWGAMGAVLTYMPDARLELAVPMGVGMAMVALAISARAVIRSLGAGAGTYQGYPLSIGALRVPLLLVAGVLAAHAVLPEVPVVTLVALLAPLLTGILLVAREGRRALRRMLEHVTGRLPGSSGELTLFLSAGLLTAGFSGLTTGGSWVPFTRFTAWEAWLVLVATVAVSMLGIHPVISIAVSATLLAPAGPDPTLFAVTGLLGWGLVVAGGPLSGTNVFLQGRYGIDNFLLVRWNAAYVGGMLVIALGWLYGCAALLGVNG